MKPSALALLLVAVSLASPGARAAHAAWQQLKSGGAIVLMRHAATVPGIGDPPGFKLGDCATQRNLSEAGRRDARAIGASFRARQVVPGAVWSSRWCRCLDTARLAFGQVQPTPALDSMFEDDAAASASKLRDLRARLARRVETTPLVLVTHDVNIRALTGQSLAPGEMLLTRLRGERLEVVGRLATQAVAQSPPP